MPWNDNLQGPHLNIAGDNASPMRVLAGPGTGKTYALMRRIWRLLESGADPRRILVCSFTRTAAKDLESELAKLGVQGADDVYAGTLHGLSFGILSSQEVLEITGRVPRPLMDFEARFMISDLCHSGGLKVSDCEERLQAFAAAWARLQSDEPDWLAEPADRAFDQALREWLLFHGAMLIGELVPECRRYLRNNPLCPERGKFDHVLVDEYQDLNRAEQETLDLLAENGTLAVIGDDNQSIYSFKHAHPAGIVDFHANHPNTANHSLTVCQRCPQRVVKMSNALLVSGNLNARQLQPNPNNPDGEVHIVQWQSIAEEADGIAAIIKRRIDSNAVQPGKVLVLAQRRKFGYAVRDALANLGVPVHSFFSEQELDGNPKNKGDYDAQEAFTLLTLLASPDDLVALRCWCGFGSASLGSPAWFRTRAYAAENNLGIRPVLELLACGQLVLPHTSSLVARYKLLIESKEACAGLSGAALLDALFPAGPDWTDPLRGLVSSLEEADYPAADLLRVLRDGVVQPEMPTETDYVRVMSLHKSKGLTADFVAVVGLLEGIVPSQPDRKKSREEQEAKLQEDRRVFYVAITRSKKTLILSSVTQLPLADAATMKVVGKRIRGTVVAAASRFLQEMGPDSPKPIAGKKLPA